MILVQALVDDREEEGRGCIVVQGRTVDQGCTVAQADTGAQYTVVQADTGAQDCIAAVHQRHIADQVGILRSRVQICLPVPKHSKTIIRLRLHGDDNNENTLGHDHHNTRRRVNSSKN